MTLEELKNEIREGFGVEIGPDEEALILDKTKSINEKVKYLVPRDVMVNLDNYIKMTQLLMAFEASDV